MLGRMHGHAEVAVADLCTPADALEVEQHDDRAHGVTG